VEKAFRETFQSIKRNDAVIVGIYDRYSDQAAENAGYTRRYSPLNISGIPPTGVLRTAKRGPA